MYSYGCFQGDAICLFSSSFAIPHPIHGVGAVLRISKCTRKRIPCVFMDSLGYRAKLDLRGIDIEVQIS